MINSVCLIFSTPGFRRMCVDTGNGVIKHGGTVSCPLSTSGISWLASQHPNIPYIRLILELDLLLKKECIEWKDDRLCRRSSLNFRSHGNNDWHCMGHMLTP
jgi:hypothetical protein